MDDAVATLRPRAEELEQLGDEEALAEVLYLLGQHISWTDGDPTDELERAARIANTLGNLRLEAAVISWLCVDAFWYDGSVDDGLKLCARLSTVRTPAAKQAGCSSSAGTSSAWRAGKRKAGPISRKARPDSWSSDGPSTLTPLSMMTACVSLLAGRYEEAEQTIMPAHDALKAYGETGYLSTVSANRRLCPGRARPFGRSRGVRRRGQGDRRRGRRLDSVPTGGRQRREILAARGEHDAARDLAEESLAFLGRAVCSTWRSSA